MEKQKKKKTLKYTKCFKVYEKELTWDLFIKYLNDNMEFCFYLNDITIDIAFHYKGKTKVYELNISSGENRTNLIFNSVDELISFKAFNNKSLYDIWDELEIDINADTATYSLCKRTVQNISPLIWTPFTDRRNNSHRSLPD